MCFNVSQEDWIDIFKILVPSLLVIAGWWVALRSQFRASDRMIKNNTLLAAAQEMRAASQTLSEKCLPFVADIHIVGNILQDAKNGKPMPNTIGSGWTKSLTWDEFLTGMSDHSHEFGIAFQQSLAPMSKYEYLYDFEWRKFGEKIHQESNEIEDEARRIISDQVAALQKGEILETDDAEKMMQLAKKAQNLAIRVRKQITKIEKALVGNVINVEAKHRLKIETVTAKESKNGSTNEK